MEYKTIAKIYDTAKKSTKALNNINRGPVTQTKIKCSHEAICKYREGSCWGKSCNYFLSYSEEEHDKGE